jgi:4-hydroxy-tetrahydrodipicolinate synthase
MFYGLGTALITPFDENFKVDYEALRKITRFQIDSNINALIVLGTTGESPVISLSEREKIVATVIEEAGGRTKILVGTGTNNTNDVVEMNKIAEKQKVDGI